MTHFTANDTSTDMAVEYAGLGTVEDAGVAEIKLDAVLRDAERFASKYYVVPETVTEDFTQAASDAEMRVFDYLVNTEGYLSSTNVAGNSESYINLELVEKMVKGIMSGAGFAASTGKLRVVDLYRG